jgi:hypothetical protein
MEHFSNNKNSQRYGEIIDMKPLYTSTDIRLSTKERLADKLDINKNGQTTDIHIKNLPMLAWRIARGAATIEGLPVATWVAQAIFDKWERHEKSSVN